jgi:hypothetical protein
VVVVPEGNETAEDATAQMSHVDPIPDNDLAFAILTVYQINLHTFVADMVYSIWLAIENDPIILCLHDCLKMVFLCAYMWHLEGCPMLLVIFKKGMMKPSQM